MTFSEMIGYVGTAVIFTAYLPQIIHLLHEHCSAGISVRAYLLWFLSSALFLLHAVMIQDMVFIVVQIVNLIAMSVIVSLCLRFRGRLCDEHLRLYLERSGEDVVQAATQLLQTARSQAR